MTLEELESCFRLLMCYARQQGLNVVEAGARELYWTVTSADWLNMYEEPKPSVGSFSDDEGELKKILKDASVASSVDLERMAHMMKLLSDVIAAQNVDMEQPPRIDKATKGRTKP